MNPDQPPESSDQEQLYGFLTNAKQALLEARKALVDACALSFTLDYRDYHKLHDLSTTIEELPTIVEDLMDTLIGQEDQGGED